jgi:hypothetical protein
MATCPHTDGVIPLLHDNELQNPLRRETVAHMATCVTCARAFSLLEREQELFTQVVEERVDSIDFSNFWQAVEIRLSDSAPSWAVRLRLWYESWRPAWAFPVPAWAVATLLLSLVSTHIYLDDYLPQFASPPSPSPNSPPTSPVPGVPPNIIAQAPDEKSYDESVPRQNVGFGDDQTQEDNPTLIESLSTSGSGEIAVQHDAASNSTLIIWHGTSEYPQ